MEWTVSIAPSADDLRALEAMGFRREDLVDALDLHERPRIWSSASTTLIVLRIASSEPRTEQPARTLPLGLLLCRGRGLVLSSSDAELVRKIDEMVHDPAARDLDPRRLIATVIELIATDYLRQLEKIDETVEEIETRLEGSLANREVVMLLRRQKSLLHFTVALDEMLVMLDHLHREPQLQAGGGDGDWLADARVELRQALDVARLSSNGLGQMMTAFSSIIANDLNDAMKLLAAIAVVLTWPIFLAGFYGMNVPLPGQRSPLAFVVILALAVVGCSLLAWRMHRRRWL